jgi:hypothetical protein
MTLIFGAYGCIGYGFGLLGFDQIIALSHAPPLSHPAGPASTHLGAGALTFAATWNNQPSIADAVGEYRLRAGK